MAWIKEVAVSEFQFGQSMSSDCDVSLDAAPADRVRGRVQCPSGHRMALLTRGPDMLYTGKEPISLSDSVQTVVHVWCHAAGCPDAGLWEIDFARLRGSLQWRKGALELQVAELGTRVQSGD